MADPQTRSPDQTAPVHERIQRLEDELFCARYELNTLASAQIRAMERWVPGVTGTSIEVAHLNRYRWACQFVRGKRVLDIATGVGRGALMLAQDGEASSVVGVDIDAEAVRYAGLTNKHDKVTFEVGDAERYKAADKLDVVVSFETIEHLGDVPAYLASVKSVLSPGGAFMVSTPISRKTIDLHPDNEFHRVEWGLDAFRSVVEKVFSVERMYFQLRKAPRGILPRPMLRPLTKNYQYLYPVALDELLKIKIPGLKLSGYQIAFCRARD